MPGTMSKPLSRATATWGVLRSLWAVTRKNSQGPTGSWASVEEILEHLLTHRDEPIDYRTVASHLRALEKKELAVSRKEGRLLYYRPTVDELVAVAGEIEAFLSNIIHDDPALLDELERQLLERRYEIQTLERRRAKRRSQAS